MGHYNPTYTNYIYFLVQLKNKYVMVNADTTWKWYNEAMRKLDNIESVITMIPHPAGQLYAISQLLLNAAAMFCWALSALNGEYGLQLFNQW